MSGEPQIWCPQCKWRPRAEDRWACLPGCGTSWHTFWTGGICPGCAHQWQQTQCLACHAISPHKAWYHWPDDTSGGQQRARELDLTSSR